MSISVRAVSHAYGARQALRDLSFDLPGGSFAALLGPNGAGKSTLFALLTRLVALRSGHISVAGHDLGRDPLRALAAMGVVFQQPTLDLDLTVRQNMAYFAALHGLTGRDRETRIDAALDRLAIRDRADARVRELNGGHRRRTEIARALLHRPRVLLLDEPTVGLDAATRRSITDHVHACARDGGMTVLWATHLTDEIAPTDTVLLLHRGRLMAEGTASDLAGDMPIERWFLSRTGATA